MKQLTQLLAGFIVLYLVVSAVRPDIAQNWRDDWRVLFQSDSTRTVLVSTPIPPTAAPFPTATSEPIATPTVEPTLAPPVPAPTSETLPAIATAQPTDQVKAAEGPGTTSKPTATSMSTAAFTPTPTLPPTATPTATSTPTATPLPTSTPSPTPTETEIPTSAPTVTPTTKPNPHSGLTESELVEAREYALKLINDARTAAGLNVVTLDDNTATQSHAEDMRANCFASHWGSDGLKPYMRYTLAGGQQHSAENISGLDYCITASDGYRANINITQDIRESMTGLMESPGHRRNILNPYHRKVNIGLAWDDYNFKIVQLFVGDYVEYHATPHIENGVLALRGKVNETVRVDDENALGAQIFYDPLPYALTRGQLSRTYCYNNGVQIAALRPPLEPRWFYDDDFVTKSVNRAPCPNPHEIGPNLPAPRSPDEAHEFWQEAYDASQTRVDRLLTYPWITAKTWSIHDQDFAVSADITDLLLAHGTGVYTIVLWGEINGEDEPISEYSIFVTTLPPPPSPTSTATITPAPTSTPTATITPTPISAPEIDIHQLEDLTHEIINAQRVMHGLEPLDHVDTIRLIARSHSQDMALNDYFSHVNPEGLDPTDRGRQVGYDCRKDFGSYYTYGLAENIHQGWIYGSIRTLNGKTEHVDWLTPEELAQSAVNGWMSSPGHRQNILDASYDRAGMGAAIADDGKVFFTQNFC